MDTSVPYSCKNIWVLLSGTSLLKSQDYVGSLLKNNASKLVNGILYYNKSSPPRKLSDVKEILSKNNIQDTSPEFLLKLSTLLEIEPLQAFDLFMSYLMYEYNGTPKTIKSFFANEKSLQTLLHYLWDYYYAERLFALFSLRQILSNWQDNSKHPYKQIFSDFISTINQDDTIIKQLIAQLEESVACELPQRSGLTGPYLQEVLTEKLLKNNINEQLVLIQCILLYYRNFDPTMDNVRKLLSLFMSHGFGTKLNSNRFGSFSTHQLVPKTEKLLQLVGFLESMVITECLQLDLFCKCVEQELEDHWLLKDAQIMKELDEIVRSLSPSFQQYSVIFMSWMVIRSYDTTPLEYSSELVKYFGSVSCELKIFEYLESWLESDTLGTIRGTAVSETIKSTIAKLLSHSFSIFEEPLARVSLNSTLNILNSLLEEEAIATNLLLEREENGLWIPLLISYECFPFALEKFLSICLTLARTRAAEPLVQLLMNINVYSEEISPNTAWQRTPSGVKTVVLSYDKYLFDDRNLLIQIDSVGEVSNNGCLVTWKNIKINGLLVLTHLYQEKMKLLTRGYHNAITEEDIGEMYSITRLAAKLLENDHKIYSHLSQIVECSLEAFRLLTRFPQVPRVYISGLLDLFSIVTQISDKLSNRLWEMIVESGFFPYMIGLTKDVSAVANGEDTNTSKIGEIIAFEECINAEYQLCLSYLNFVMHSLPPKNSSSTAILVHILSEIFPSHQRWQYRRLIDCAKIGHYCLQIFHNILILNPDSAKELIDICKLSLLNKQAGSTLLDVIVNGEMAVREVVEEAGNELALIDHDLIIMVRKSISVLNRLLQLQEKCSHNSLIASALEESLSATNTGKPNIILVLSRYVSQPYDTRLSTLAVTLLTRLAKHFPMSMLACFGSQADFVRDHLLYKLEKVTEDLRLKVAILDYLSACIKHQPGLIEMFLDTESDETPKDQTGSCLSTVLEILEEKMTDKYYCPEELHCAAVKFLCTFWLQPHLIAIESLKRTKELWTYICFPITNGKGPINTKIVGYVMRILAREIFYAKSLQKNLDSSLVEIFKQIKDEDILCKISEQLREDCCSHFPSSELSFLLSSWRDFLVSLSKYNPITVDDDLRCTILVNLITSLKFQLYLKEGLDPHQLTLLADTCTFVLHRWSASCLGETSLWFQPATDILYVVDELKESLDIHFLVSVETFLAHMLKAFREENEDLMAIEDFKNWLAPWCNLFRYCFTSVEKQVIAGNITGPSIRLANITLSMLQLLFGVSLNPPVFATTIRNNLVIETLDSLLCEMIKRRIEFNLAESILASITLLSTEENTAHLIQMSDVPVHLSRVLQMSARDPDDPSKIVTFSWSGMFHAVMKLIASLLFALKHHFTVDAIEFIQSNFTEIEKCFTSFKNFPQTKRIQDVNNAMLLLCLLIDYKTVWLAKHKSSYEKLASDVSKTCYSAIAYLIRPRLLHHALKHLTPNATLNHFPLETLTFAAGNKQESLTEVTAEKSLKRSLSHEEKDSQPQLDPDMQNAFHILLIHCLTFLHKFYPTPRDARFMSESELKHNEAQFDLSFSTPNIDPTKTTSFGSLLYCLSYCARHIYKLDRSDNSSECTDNSKAKLSLILEKALSLLVSRALYVQAFSTLSQREKENMKRELKSELSSVLAVVSRPPKRTSSSSSLSTTPRSPLNSITDKPYVRHLLERIENLL